MSATNRIRCSSQALTPGGWWKSCIREEGHTPKEPHVWLESFSKADGHPILVTWYGPRTTEPTVSYVLVGVTGSGLFAES